MSRKSKKGNKKLPIFQKGYGFVRKKMNEFHRGLMSCQTCNYFYQGDNDEYEVCHNSNVTEWDMVNAETRTFCSLWQPVNGKNEVALKTVGEKISSELEANLRIISRNFSNAQKAKMERNS